MARGILFRVNTPPKECSSIAHGARVEGVMLPLGEYFEGSMTPAGYVAVRVLSEEDYFGSTAGECLEKLGFIGGLIRVRDLQPLTPMALDFLKLARERS